ncbi:MAG: hypothetical protein ACAI43_02910, partial [Phycisphaerae bacterium]
VTIDSVPNPVLGTFWPYSADKDARLTGVTAAAKRVTVERTALTVRELIQANIGADVTLVEMPPHAHQAAAAGREVTPVSYNCTLMSIPVQTGDELERLAPHDGGEKLSVYGNVVMVKTVNGIKPVDMNRIVDVTFAKPPKTALAREEMRNLFTLHLDWAGKPAQKQADVGMMYLQKGVRWIPNYKVIIDGKGNAVLQLQATLINELADMDGVTVHLVVGVPSFAFSSSQDPMSLQQAAARLSVHMGSNDQNVMMLNNGNATQFAFSNAIMTQQAGQSPVVRAAPAPGGARAVDLGPDAPSGGEKAEDLYVFSVRNVTLKKGQRMVLPVAQYAVQYKDVYSLDVPVAPPPEVFRQFDDNRKAEVARQLASPKVVHMVRLINSTDAPFTTAPAIIVRNDKLDPKDPATFQAPGSRLIAQNLMTYTAPGGATDLDLTTTVDVVVKKSDVETGRTVKALVFDRYEFVRLDLAGKITLTSYAKRAIEVEVTRTVYGNLGSATAGGRVEGLNLLEDNSYGPASRWAQALPHWHGWYSWPWWWTRVNGVGRVTWNVTLEPGKPAELGYAWHYFWP